MHFTQVIISVTIGWHLNASEQNLMALMFQSLTEIVMNSADTTINQESESILQVSISKQDIY